MDQGDDHRSDSLWMGGDTPADEPMETQYHSEHEGLIESVVFEQYDSLNRTRWRLPICSQSRQ